MTAIACMTDIDRIAVASGRGIEHHARRVAIPGIGLNHRNVIDVEAGLGKSVGIAVKLLLISALVTSSLDAVIAAPKHHKVLFENGQLRVLEVTLEPNDEEPVHHHRWPSVFERTQHRFRSCPPGSVPMAESIRRSE